MEFNIKGISTWAWVKIGLVIAFMASMLIFKPNFDEYPNVVLGVEIAICIWIIYELLKMFGILGKIFNK